LLALGQHSMRRTLAYMLAYESGMVFYGLATVSFLGLTGAIVTAFNTVLAVTLIFISLGMLEQPDGRPPGVERRDLLWRWPVAGVGLLGGGMVLLGLPPMSGFAGKMLLYQAAVVYGWHEVALLLLATALAGLALARLARDRLLGAGEHLPTPEPLMLDELEEFSRPPPRRLEPEAHSTALLAVLLLAVCLGLGLYPQPLLVVIRDAISALVFV
jgi:formate hydrogenlyase subunit 3/multisubunit Na+/H+ antiporter MnhD subunit